MPRQREREVEIFNFSFLDILACTIGALLFLLILVIVNSSNTTYVRKEPKVVEKPKEKPPEEKQVDEKQYNTMLQEIKKVKNDIKSEEELATETKENDKPKGISFRIPMRKKTTKKSKAVLECTDGKVYIMIVDKSFYESNYNRSYERLSSDFGILTITRLSTAYGEDENRILESDSEIAKLVEQVDPEREYVSLDARPSGFKVFRAVRDRLWLNGIDINWFPYEENNEYKIPITPSSGDGPSYTQ